MKSIAILIPPIPVLPSLVPILARIADAGFLPVCIPHGTYGRTIDDLLDLSCALTLGPGPWMDSQRHMDFLVARYLKTNKPFGLDLSGIIMLVGAP